MPLCRLTLASFFSGSNCCFSFAPLSSFNHSHILNSYLFFFSSNVFFSGERHQWQKTTFCGRKKSMKTHGSYWRRKALFTLYRWQLSRWFLYYIQGTFFRHFSWCATKVWAEAKTKLVIFPKNPLSSCITCPFSPRLQEPYNAKPLWPAAG